MKKRAYNPPFAVNALFLFGITGKCHLSINKHIFFCLLMRKRVESQIQHAEESIKHSVSVVGSVQRVFAVCYTGHHSATLKEILPKLLWHTV